MDETSSTTQAKSADVKTRATINFFALIFLIIRALCKSQVKRPISFRNPTKTIIPIKKKIISIEERRRKSCSFAAPVKRIMVVPRNAKLNRNFQKRIVPKIERKKPTRIIIWSKLKPACTASQLMQIILNIKIRIFCGKNFSSIIMANLSGSLFPKRRRKSGPP